MAVPVEIVILLFRLLPPVVAIETDEQDNVPAPTATILWSPLPVPEFIVRAPDIVRELEPAIVTVLALFPALIVREDQTAATSTVTEILLFITTV